MILLMCGLGVITLCVYYFIHLNKYIFERRSMIVCDPLRLPILQGSPGHSEV